MRLHTASLHLFIEGEPDPEVHVLGDGKVAIELPGDVDLTLEGSVAAVESWLVAHLDALRESSRAAELRRNPEYDFGWFREKDGTQARLSQRSDGMLYLFHARDRSTELFGVLPRAAIHERIDRLVAPDVDDVRALFPLTESTHVCEAS